MFLVIGLGNPGPKYLNTRHSIGFTICDIFNNKHNFSPYRLNKRSNALESDGVINKEIVKIIKPQTFMNNSGKAVAYFFRKRNKDTIKIIIVHDDADLSIGNLKISKNRGSAGHHGIDSIIEHIKTKDFIRVRIGIRQIEIKKIEGKKNNDGLAGLVLKPFNKKEVTIIKQIADTAVLAIEKIIVSGVSVAMNDFNNH